MGPSRHTQTALLVLGRRVDECERVENREVAAIAGDDFTYFVLHQGRSKQRVGDALSSELVFIEQRKGERNRVAIDPHTFDVCMVEVETSDCSRFVHCHRRCKAPRVGNDAHKLVKDQWCYDKRYVRNGKLVHEVPPNPLVVRSRGNMRNDQNIRVDRALHGAPRSA